MEVVIVLCVDGLFCGKVCLLVVEFDKGEQLVDAPIVSVDDGLDPEVSALKIEIDGKGCLIIVEAVKFGTVVGIISIENMGGKADDALYVEFPEFKSDDDEGKAKYDAEEGEFGEGLGCEYIGDLFEGPGRHPFVPLKLLLSFCDNEHLIAKLISFSSLEDSPIVGKIFGLLRFLLGRFIIRHSSEQNLHTHLFFTESIWIFSLYEES